MSDEYIAEVRKRVEAAVSRGVAGLSNVLPFCDGADPVLVEQLLRQYSVNKTTRTRSRAEDAIDSRLFLDLPAPDPSLSQWWFTTNGISAFCDRVESRASLFNDARLLCLGTPTMAYHLARRGWLTDVFDVDPHVIDVLRSSSGPGCKAVYDAANDFPSDLMACYHLVLLDPPWYEEAISTFLFRAFQALLVGGELFCTLPPRLTRPAVSRLVDDIIVKTINSGNQLLSFEHGVLRYQVPFFELAALRRSTSFSGIPWRSGDLIHVKKVVEGSLYEPRLVPRATTTFARNPREFRVFLSNSQSLEPAVLVKKLDQYSANISTRAHPHETPDLWTSEKVGLRVGQLSAIREALSAWAANCGRTEAVETLKTRGVSGELSVEVIRVLDDNLCLWSKYAAAAPLRTDQQIEEAKAHSLTMWATKPSKRVVEEEGDAFRGPYQRDRDRILWSAGLRRLSNKTQLFPVEYDDNLRQRLTHSIEVSQLAATIGASFGLDRELIEAGSLAHDIGHTPFGHAGEYAIDKVLASINTGLGFNHYEHGVDVVRWLEGPYYVSPAASFFGLNLVPQVCECILKHTYCQNGLGLSTDELVRNTKHLDIISGGYCHLEGQAVRVADKISYLVSDLEDGIRLRAISPSDLTKCRFFHRASLDLVDADPSELYGRFLDQRRVVLKLLMEDVLQASSKRLMEMVPQGVGEAKEYTINHSAEMLDEVEQIWNQLQVNKLHKDPRVIAANLNATRITTELLVAYSVLPELIDQGFCAEHKRLWNQKYVHWYVSRAGKKVKLHKELLAFLSAHMMIGGIRVDNIDIEHLVMAKDYVAALTDSRAKAFHRQLFEGAG